MNDIAINSRVAAKAATTPPVRPATRRGDDKAMLKAAANLTRDLNQPRAAIYWADLLGSALLGYGALAVAPSVVAVGSHRAAVALALVHAGSKPVAARRP